MISTIKNMFESETSLRYNILITREGKGPISSHSNNTCRKRVVTSRHEWTLSRHLPLFCLWKTYLLTNETGRWEAVEVVGDVMQLKELVCWFEYLYPTPDNVLSTRGVNPLEINESTVPASPDVILCPVSSSHDGSKARVVVIIQISSFEEVGKRSVKFKMGEAGRGAVGRENEILLWGFCWRGNQPSMTWCTL